MKLVKKIWNKTRIIIHKLTSKRKKYMFEVGKSRSYKYMDEIFCKDKGTYYKLLNSFSYKSDTWQKFWDSQESYSVNKYFPKTFRTAKEFILGDFFSLYNDKPEMIDIGCASGEMTLEVAQYCKRICGFEYSQKMVDTAIIKAKKEGIENAEFYQADATSLELSCQCDAGMIMAMLMYLDDIDKICKILQNVYSHLKPGAFLCTRDTLNNENTDIIYMLNKKNGYTAFYWSKELYYEQFKKAGFELKKEVIFENVTSRRMNFIHIGNIWQKPL